VNHRVKYQGQITLQSTDQRDTSTLQLTHIVTHQGQFRLQSTKCFHTVIVFTIYY